MKVGRQSVDFLPAVGEFLLSIRGSVLEIGDHVVAIAHQVSLLFSIRLGLRQLPGQMLDLLLGSAE